jgi:hypothetical protein
MCQARRALDYYEHCDLYGGRSCHRMYAPTFSIIELDEFTALDFVFIATSILSDCRL